MRTSPETKDIWSPYVCEMCQCDPTNAPFQLKQKLHISLQRVTLCSKAAEDAEVSHGEAERARVMAEARLLDVQKDRELVLAEKMQLAQEHQQLKNRVID